MSQINQFNIILNSYGFVSHLNEKRTNLLTCNGLYQEIIHYLEKNKLNETEIEIQKHYNQKLKLKKIKEFYRITNRHEFTMNIKIENIMLKEIIKIDKTPSLFINEIEKLSFERLILYYSPLMNFFKNLVKTKEKFKGILLLFIQKVISTILSFISFKTNSKKTNSLIMKKIVFKSLPKKIVSRQDVVIFKNKHSMDYTLQRLNGKLFLEDIKNLLAKASLLSNFLSNLN